MRGALLVCCLAVAAAGEERARIRTETARTEYFVHEPIRITLRVDYDAAFFRTNAVQMFQRRFDVPVQVSAPWLEALPGAIMRRPDIAPGARASLVVNGEAAEAAHPEAGRLAIRRTFLAREPGRLVVDAPTLRFAYGTEFTEDFLNGRVATDRREVTVRGAPLTIEVRPLPEPPAGFAGAVGCFSIEAVCKAGTLAVGETFTLVLRLRGDGNLERFDTPRLDLDGLHVYGAIDDKGQVQRTIKYDLAPLKAVPGVPPVPFTYFDPLVPGYRTIRTKPIPLKVTGIEPETTPAREDRTLPWYLLIPVALAGGVWVAVRSRREVDADGGARAAFLKRAPHGLADAFAEYLASHLDVPAASVIAPELEQRLRDAGVPADLATRTAALLERLVAARYGGATGDETAAAHRLVDALEDHWQ